MNFETIGLSKDLIDALAVEHITEPTSVQEQAIPLLLEGKDVVMLSQTGSGKTLAYLLPIYQRKCVEKGTQVIVIVPTKELAMQVHHEVQLASKNANIPLKSAVLFGNVNIEKQIERLREKPQIIIGTTDRILALIKKKKIQAHTVKTLIVDEADRLLDKQSIGSIKEVRKTLMRDTQVAFVSATFSSQSLEMIKDIAPNFVLVQTQAEYQVPPNITHLYYVCDRRDKLENLRKLMGIIKPEKSIAFINQLNEIHVAVEKLNFHDVKCEGVHSDSLKQQRQKRLMDFSTGKLNLLVCTDLASRGLHLDSVACVFSVTTAEDPTDYLHRAGRTGRNDAEGMSICLITETEMQFVDKYRNKLGIKINEIDMRNGDVVVINEDKTETLLASIHNTGGKKKKKKRIIAQPITESE